MAGENFEFEANVTLPDSNFTCANSCNGLLCLENCKSSDEIYVCNPILGEYITIPIVNRITMHKVKSVLGFSSRSNQFKVLQINCPKRTLPYGRSIYMAEIYTIGNGTRQWKSIGIAPSCPFDFPEDSINSFLNGSIHWTDGETQQIVYFDFESEQFGSLPSPPAWRDGRWSKFTQVRVGVLDGCLCIYAFGYLKVPELMEKWVMKEYGVEESWTTIFSTHKLERLEIFYLFDQDTRLIRLGGQSGTTTYGPSFISLQDVAKSEQLTVLSRTRTMMVCSHHFDQDSLEAFSCILSLKSREWERISRSWKT